MDRLTDAASLCPNPTLVFAADLLDEGSIEDIFKETIKTFGKRSVTIFREYHTQTATYNKGRLDLLFNVSRLNPTLLIAVILSRTLG